MSTKTKKLETKKLRGLPKGQVRLIGRGNFSWPRTERVIDRYGTCHVSDQHNESQQAESWFPKAGERGTLIARVIEARQSDHIGDLFRGLFPRTPKVGDIIVLGYGSAFTEQVEAYTTFGVKPIKARNSDWLNPRALYDIHNSIVELMWVPQKDLTK